MAAIVLFFKNWRRVFHSCSSEIFYVPLAYILHLLIHADFPNISVRRAILNSAGWYVIKALGIVNCTYYTALSCTVQFADFSLAQAVKK